MTGPGVNTVLFVNFMIYEEVFLGTYQSVDADSQPQHMKTDDPPSNLGGTSICFSPGKQNNY